MKTLYRIYEFFFDRWKRTIVGRGSETWQRILPITGFVISENQRNYVDYKYINKFDGSEKIVRKYLN